MTTPYNNEAEQKVLGSILLRPAILADVNDTLKEHHFHSEANKTIYTTIRKMFIEGKPIDFGTLSSQLTSHKLLETVGGSGYLAEVVNSVTTSSSYTFYIEILEKKHIQRVALKTARELEETCQNDIDLKSDTLRAIYANFALLVGSDNTNPDISSIIPELEKEREEFHNKKETGKELIGTSCGFKKLDGVIDGLRGGHLWVLGGYTSAGKTTFSLNIMANLVRQKIKGSFYSLEMSRVDIVRKLMGLLSGINPARMTKATLMESELERYEEAKEILTNSQSRVHTKQHTLSEILMSMTAEQMKKEADVFFIDYAQLIDNGHASEYDTMRTVATELQSFAQQKDIPIILLSQVSNESAKNPENNIIGFKGSGALGASADLAIELINTETDREKRMRAFALGEPVGVKAVIKKNRHGRVGEIDYKFDTRTGVFSEMLDAHDQYEEM